jgi:hypothetical protein
MVRLFAEGVGFALLLATLFIGLHAACAVERSCSISQGWETHNV